MGEYRLSGQAVWDIKYHLIWITKYGHKMLRGEVAVRGRELIRQVCQAREVSMVGERCHRTLCTCWWRLRRSWRQRSWCNT